jgi:hypothetical protein
MALILGAFSLASGAAWAQGTEAAPTDAAAGPPSDLKALADSCDAHKFETMIVVDGSGRGKRVKICGKVGQTDADWLVTLRDSVKKVEADPAMTQVVKDQIVAALKTEIARMEIIAKPASTAPLANIAIPSEPVSAPEAAPQYSSVPQLPAPLPRASAKVASATKPPVERPRLTIRCALPREPFGECARLERETQLLIRADEDVAGGASLRFLRGGDQRAELDLGPLHKGESLRERLPTRVCSGVLRGKVQVQVLNKSQVAETLGPYSLYCGS